MADNWKCIWVREGRRDLHALHRMIQVLRRGVMTLFPEGTRSRDGSVAPGRPGAGFLILATRPRVVPVAIDGTQEVLPIGGYVPRRCKRVSVSFGPPVDYADPARRVPAPAHRSRESETSNGCVDGWRASTRRNCGVLSRSLAGTYGVRKWSGSLRFCNSR
ncbi:MAG: lysophospholipid acyltransferase family protein [Gemmatimonadales bacterium]